MKEQLKGLRADIQALEERAREGLSKPCVGGSFGSRIAGLQQGKFIAYGHVLTLIDKLLKDAKNEN